MTLIRLQPQQFHSNEHPEFGQRQFRRFFTESENGCAPQSNFERAAYAPKVDVSEDETCLHFAVELPGLKSEDVKITITAGVLTIRGEKKRTDEQQTKSFHRTERKFGEFVRQFALPENAGDDVSAKFNDGVLNIAIAKIQPEKPIEREIKIAVN